MHLSANDCQGVLFPSQIIASGIGYDGIKEKEDNYDYVLRFLYFVWP